MTKAFQEVPYEYYSRTSDEQKASEAAFHDLPLNPKWSRHAQVIYLGILAVTNGRDIVADADG